MRFTFWIGATVLLLLAAPLIASERAAFFTCDFLEKVADQPWQSVDRRSYAAPLDAEFQFSMGNFSYRLVATALHDTIVQIQSQVNCTADPPRNFFKQDVVFKDAAVFCDSALVRGSSVYRIKLQFDSLGHNAADCEYPIRGDSYASDPSGDFDFYYVKQSLGDYRWNEIRDAFERDYDGLVERFQLTDRTKTNFFIAPCPAADIGWDPRWRNGYDYARHSVYAHFTHAVNELHPEVVYMVRLMRIHGYAPAFLLEGMAASLNYTEVHLQNIAKANQLPALEQLGVSREYRALDPALAVNVAGSFVNFLYNTRGRGKLIEFYRQSTDLTFAAAFTGVYGEPLTMVEAEWKQFVDTASLNLAALNFFGDRARMFLKTPEMMVYARAAYEQLGDTTWAPRLLSSLYYTFGDFERAAAVIQPLALTSERDKGTRVFFGNLLLAAGKVDSAAAVFAPLAATDTSMYQAGVKLAQIEELKGNPEKALELIGVARTVTKNPGLMVDFDIALGDAFVALGQRDSAAAYFQTALDHAKILVGAFNDNSLHHLRVGKAAVRLGSADLALQHLDVALFLEERMFYIGQILLAIGQAKDLKKLRAEAIADYKEVLALPTAYLDRRLAERLLKSPYQN